ncbi:hypothetical protein Trydic_g5633, partial [Trypoxylus dichotomus]
IAAHRKYDFEVTVTNNNTNTISASIKPDKNNLIFLEGDRKLVKGKSKVSIPVTYIAPSVGYYTTEMKLVLNDSAFILMYILASVYPISLQLSTELVEFTKERTQGYVDIINRLNAEIAFSWKMTCKNFQIRPMDGIIKANCVLTCSIEYLPHVDGQQTVDVDFFCGGTNTHQLRLVASSAIQKLSFVESQLIFKDLPLNIPIFKMAVLTNTSGIPLSFSLIEDDFTKYVSVFPASGVVLPYSYEALEITVTLNVCVSFSTKIRFNISKSQVLALGLRGNVVFPHIAVYPSTLQFAKIACSTADIVPLTVENMSEAVATVKFDMSMYTEFTVVESDNQWNTNVVETVTLEKHEMVKLYLRFVPYAITTDKFILPMIINSILGPVTTVQDAVSICNVVMDISYSHRTNISCQLPVVMVHCHAIAAKITLSKRLINLSYVPPPNQCQPTYELRIFNAQTEMDTICIRTDELYPPLSLKYLRGKEVVQKEHVIICTLEAQEEVFLEASFTPTLVGTYKAVLPVFLKSDHSYQPHNILCLQGTFPPPIIVCNRPLVHLIMIPLRIHVILLRKFVLRNHFANCTVQFANQSDTDERFEILDRRPIGKNTEELSLAIHLTPQKCATAEFNIMVACSCSGKCVLFAHKVVENSFLTNYALVNAYLSNPQYDLQMKTLPTIDLMRRQSLMSIADGVSQIHEEFDLRDFFESYPFFPEKDDQLYDYMQSCVLMMESWISRQCFFGKAAYKIPRGIRYLHFDEKRNGVYCIPPLVQMLINLVGDQMMAYFEIRPIEDSDLIKAKYIYAIYKKALKFLIDLGARFCCIYPEYLMTFSMYTFYVNCLSSEYDDILHVSDYLEFNRLSKLCWLNLILQIYKLLVYGRLIRPLEALHPAVDREGTPHFEYRRSIKNMITNNHLFGNAELLVLNWLEFHYNTVRTTYWTSNDYLTSREITHFGENMDDGFVYAAVTLAYCPYLAKHFEGLRKWPTTHEEILHNNIKVIQSWEILNFNLYVSVEDLAAANPMRTLVIAGYLFEVLPNMYPMEALNFKVGLSEQESKLFLLKNNNDFPVGYRVTLYENVDKCFTVDKSLYEIKPHRSCKIKVTYWAKFVRHVQCILIISGERNGYRYAISKVVTLTGEPDVTYTTAEMEIVTELYKYRETKLSIKSPYPVKASYAIQFTCQECSTVDEAKDIPYRLGHRAFTLSRCIPIEFSLECDEDGVGELTFCTFAINTMRVLTWVFFTNSEVGDFAILIPTAVSPSTLQQMLEVRLPKRFGEFSLERCKRRQELYLEVPCQNRVMWSGIIEVLQKFAVADVDFWKDVVYTTTGMHVLQRLVHFTEATSRISTICRPVDYNIATPKGSNVILPNTIHIHDQCLSASVRVPLKFIDRKSAGSFFLTLKSCDDLDIRQYHVVVMRATSDDDE